MTLTAIAGKDPDIAADQADGSLTPRVWIWAPLGIGTSNERLRQSASAGA